MKVRLISENERLKIKIESATFYYRRALSSTIANLRNKYTVRGEFDAVGFADEILEQHVLDWKGVYDENDKEISFQKELIKFLPDNIKANLLEAINSVGGELEKN